MHLALQLGRIFSSTEGTVYSDRPIHDFAPKREISRMSQTAVTTHMGSIQLILDEVEG